jgi:hypothetical protein
MPSTTSTKLTALHVACPDLRRPAPAASHAQTRLPQDLPFVLGALLAAGVVVAFVLALHSA